MNCEWLLGKIPKALAKNKNKKANKKKKQAKLMGLYIVQNLPQSQREDEQCEEIANRMGNRVHEMGLMMGSID